MYNSFFKRGLDLLLAIVLIVIFAFPMLLVALITKIDSPGPVLFRQTRYGKKKQPFSILKFRSMPLTAPKHVPSNNLTNVKLSKWQSIVRKYSLDELPQLFNILFGDMSFVGPRPVILKETDLINERDKYSANDVRPGLTGLAQIKGRDKLDYIQKAKYDGEYVGNLNLYMDAKCLICTVTCVLTHKGYCDNKINQ